MIQIACARFGGCVDPAIMVIRVNLGGREIELPVCAPHSADHVVITGTGE